MLTAALNALKNGQLVAFPTETVYGLGADATNEAAVRAIYAAKSRPFFNPLIVHCHSVEQLKTLVIWNEQGEKIAGALMPAPITLVLQKKGNVLAKSVYAGLPTIAVRIPQHPVALELLRQFGKPIAAPSANPSGLLSPTRAAHVRRGLGDAVAVVLDDPAPCVVGVESTIIDLSSPPLWRVLRHGGMPQEQIEIILGTKPAAPEAGIKSPGQLLRHYAPQKKIRLNATEMEENEGLLAFGTPLTPPPFYTLNLSAQGDVEEAAANLFDFLHQLDASPCTGIAVMPIPPKGVGVAINDRLQRAAAIEVGTSHLKIS